MVVPTSGIGSGRVINNADNSNANVVQSGAQTTTGVDSDRGFSKTLIRRKHISGKILLCDSISVFLLNNHPIKLKFSANTKMNNKRKLIHFVFYVSDFEGYDISVREASINSCSKNEILDFMPQKMVSLQNPNKIEIHDGQRVHLLTQQRPLPFVVYHT